MALYGIVAGMEVVGCCGRTLGAVEAVEGGSLRLELADGGGEGHYLPLEWVATVDDKVHLRITRAWAREELCLAPTAGWA